MEIINFSFRKPESNIDKVLGTLLGLEREIFKKLHAIGCHLHTVDEISEWMGITNDQVIAINKKAINKLRHPSRKQMVTGTILEEICQE